MKKSVPPVGDASDWNFARVNTQELTHGMLYYPARMVPHIAGRLLSMLWRESTVILDPFAGSGTTLLESLIRKHRGIGIDVNPVAVYLARAKCTVPNTEVDTNLLIKTIKVEADQRALTADPIYAQAKKNIDYWYDPDIARDLLAIHRGIQRYISDANDPSHQWVLYASFAATIYACSRGTQDGSSFHSRESPNYEHDPLTHFRRKVAENLVKVGELRAKFLDLGMLPRENGWQEIIQDHSTAQFSLTRGNSLEVLRQFPAESIGGIVTSPPYGDEHSTVNYTRYTKHAAYLLGFSPGEVKAFSQATLSSNNVDFDPKAFPITAGILQKIRQAKAEDEAKVAHFIGEYLASLGLFWRVLQPHTACCIVIANRRVRQVEIPMDAVTTELATQAGFQVETIYHRTFPKKVVAWKTISGSSMDQENIIILRKGR